MRKRNAYIQHNGTASRALQRKANKHHAPDTDPALKWSSVPTLHPSFHHHQSYTHKTRSLLQHTRLELNLKIAVRHQKAIRDLKTALNTHVYDMQPSLICYLSQQPASAKELTCAKKHETHTCVQHLYKLQSVPAPLSDSLLTQTSSQKLLDFFANSDTQCWLPLAGSPPCCLLYPSPNSILLISE